MTTMRVRPLVGEENSDDCRLDSDQHRNLAARGHHCLPTGTTCGPSGRPTETVWTRSWTRTGMFQGVEPRRLAPTAEMQSCRLRSGKKRWFAGGRELAKRLSSSFRGKVKIGRRLPDGRDELLTIMGPSDSR